MRLPRRVQVLLVVFLALMLLALSLDITVLGLRQRASDRQEATLLRARLDTRELLTALVDQETGERGFLLTGKDEFLEPYSQGRSRATATLARLRTELRGHDDLLAGVDRLESKIGAWQGLGAEFEIAAKREGRNQVVVA